MLSREDVLHIAKLANLDLTEEEISKFQIQLSGILDYVKKLDEVDTSNVVPYSHTSKQVNRFQEVDSAKTLSNKEVLQNAPRKKNGYVVTDAVL